MGIHTRRAANRGWHRPGCRRWSKLCQPLELPSAVSGGQDRPNEPCPGPVDDDRRESLVAVSSPSFAMGYWSGRQSAFRNLAPHRGPISNFLSGDVARGHGGFREHREITKILNPIRNSGRSGIWPGRQKSTAAVFAFVDLTQLGEDLSGQKH